MQSCSNPKDIESSLSLPAVFALYLIGTYKPDRQDFSVGLFANETLVNTNIVSANGPDDNQLYALYSVTELDPFTTYGLVIANNPASATTPSGYLVVQGLLQSTVQSDGDDTTTGLTTLEDSVMLYPKAGASATGGAIAVLTGGATDVSTSVPPTTTQDSSPAPIPSTTTSPSSTFAPTPIPSLSSTTTSRATGTAATGNTYPGPTGGANSARVTTGMVGALGAVAAWLVF